MKTKNILGISAIALCAGLLSSCITIQKEYIVKEKAEPVAFKMYTKEDLPVNNPPVRIKDKSSKYDIHDDNTFPLYEKFHTVDRPRGVKTGTHTYREIYRTKDATYVVYYSDCRNHDNDDWLFFYFSSESCIVDVETGIRYQIRNLQYYPLDTFFWHHKNARTIHQFIMEYPPLPDSVKKIKFHSGYAPTRKYFQGGESTTQEYNIVDFYPPIIVK